MVENLRLDWSFMLKRKEKVVRKLAAGIALLLRKNRVQTVQGFGKLAGPGRLEVTGAEGPRRFAYRHLIVATGSEPRSIPGLEIDRERVLTNTEMLSLPSRPERLSVIGAGAVGVEFASMFASFGTKVVLAEMLPRVLPLEDEEIDRARNLHYVSPGAGKPWKSCFVRKRPWSTSKRGSSGRWRARA